MSMRRSFAVCLVHSLLIDCASAVEPAPVANIPLGASLEYRNAVLASLRKMQPKISQGVPATPNQFPWAVSLGTTLNPDPYFSHFCGGVLFSGSWVITAAHCVTGLAPTNIRVTAGATELDVSSAFRAVDRILISAKYGKGKNHDNDIALLRLKSPLPISASLQSIDVISPASEAVTLKKNTAFLVAGWGTTTRGGHQVRQLLYGHVYDVPFQDCSRPVSYGQALTDNMICAGNLEQHTDSCDMDSGGPLSLDSPNPVLVGLVSWSMTGGCGVNDVPGVYTRVSNYHDAINRCTSHTADCSAWVERKISH